MRKAKMQPRGYDIFGPKDIANGQINPLVLESQ